MCPLAVAKILGRYLFTSWTVSPGYYWKYHFWIDFIHAALTGMNAATYIYLTKSVWFVMLYALSIQCSGFLKIFGLLFMFSKGTIHNPVVLSLVPIKIVFHPLWCVSLCMQIMPCILHHKFLLWILMNCVSLLIGYEPLWMFKAVALMPIHIIWLI